MTIGNPVLLSVLLAMTVVLGLQIARGLHTGRVGRGGLRYERAGQPVEFWFNLAYAAIGMVLAGWLITAVVQGGEPPQAIPVFLLFAFGLPVAFSLVRGLQTGSAGFGRTKFARKRAPLQYWAVLLAYAFVIAFLFWVVSAWNLREKPRFSKVIEPVVETVRFELRPETSLPFRNVRVDRRSGLVCGDVALDAGPRRFFGRTVGGAGQVRLENSGAGFDRAYARACGASGDVPQL